MEIKSAIAEFNTLISKIKPSDMDEFLLWTKTTTTEMLEESQKEDNSAVILNSIRDDIRESLPLEAVTKTETIVCPKSGTNSDCDPKTTVHVDAFLYDEDSIDALCDEDKMSRNYCTKCLSRSVNPLTFISHSASVDQIKFMYQYLLGDLRGKTVLDVGSRTGAVLYGAYLYSEAQHIVGVELDPSFCELQTRITNKYKLEDRIKIIKGNILHQAELLQNSDVIILNNVFEFFMPVKQQKKIWRYLHQTARKKNTVIITIPSIEESLADIQASIDISKWLQPIEICCLKEKAESLYFTSPENSDLSDISMYKVL